MEHVTEVIAALETYVGALEPDRLSGHDAAALVKLFDKGSRLCTAGRALAAKRAAAANAWKEGGYRSPEEWLAATTKTSRSAAADTLNTAERLEQLPATHEAFVSGQVSSEQAAAIAAAATADPTAEEFMLREADRSSLSGLQKTSRALVAAAQQNQAADRERIHRSRFFRSWTSADGAFEGRFRLTPDAGATVLAALDSERSDVFAQAKLDGRHESSDAYAADALVNLARFSLEFSQTNSADCPCADDEVKPVQRSDGSDEPNNRQDVVAEVGGVCADAIDGANDAEAAADQLFCDSIDGERPAEEVSRDGCTVGRMQGRRRRTPPHVVHIRVDLEALLRGHTQAGEVCEAVGVGTVPVETAQHALCDAIIRLLNVKNGQVIDICHAGRTIPTKLALALEERDRTCCVPGCDTRRHLQNHHLHPINFLGPTTLTNLARICTYHHEQITHQGAQLTGTPGHWNWHPPGTHVPFPVATPACGHVR